MKKTMTIRVKVTIANIILLIIVSIILTLGSNISAKKLIQAMPVTESIPIGEGNIISTPNILKLDPSINNIPIEDIRNNATSNFNNSIIIYMVGVIMLGGFATYIIMKKLLKSLEVFESKIETITINNLSKPIYIQDCDDEILRITDKFNNMTEKLNSSFEMQKRFSQSAAHELRTPLTIIKTKLDVFKKRNDRSKEEYEVLIDSMRDNIKRLTNIVESLLDITNSNEIDMSEQVSIDKIFRKIIEEAMVHGKKKGIRIFYEESNIFIKGNELLLYRAFYNLVENAIIYGEHNGTIEIVSKKEENSYLFLIKDDGIGISDEFKKNIFEPFFRVDKSRSRNLGGAGLGLAIVKEIIQKHNGVIQVSDNTPKGTIFNITFNKYTT